MNGVESAPDDELQLTDYLHILRRRWIWLWATTTIILVASLVLTIMRDPRYAATAQVGLGNSAAQDAIRSNSFTNVGAASRELSNEVNLAVSDAVTTEVFDQLDLEPDVTITAEDESDALRFTATAATPDDAALHANTWAQVYVDTKRRQATESIEEAVEVFATDLAALRADRLELREPLDVLEDRLTRADTEAEQTLLEVQISRLTADLATEFDLLDVQVQAVAENITSLQLSSRLAATGTARIVQIAAPPQGPTNGPLWRNLVLAGFVGLLSGAVAALLAENLDRTIKTTEDVSSLGITVLGSIPTPNRSLPESELSLATMRYSGTPVAEAYQKIRTAVEFALLGRKINSLLITSPNQSEGKTTTSINLAWAMSAVDYRVALVDVDFRRPRIHDVFNCAPSPGLSDNLLSRIPLPQLALRVDEHGSRNLIVIPTGTQPPNPADFVASPAFSALIHSIEDEADLVVLDAPPVLPVSDAPSIGRHVDAVIVVVKAGSTTRDQLVDALDNLGAVGADVIGVCVVGLRTASAHYGNYRTDAPASWLRRRAARRKQLVDLRDLNSVPETADGYLASEAASERLVIRSDLPPYRDS